MSSSPALTVFIDGRCPLCTREMRYLKQLDRHNKLRLVDLHSAELNSEFPDIDAKQANHILTAIDDNGRYLFGLDATYASWRAVGKGHWIAPLRWPGIRWLADLGYRLFARHRHRISRLLTGQSRCDSCQL